MLFITHEDDLQVPDDIKSIYFYASWMPFHNKFMLMLDKVKKIHKNIKYFAVDTDSFKKICTRFNVTSIPTVLIIKNNQEIKRIEGLTLTSAFKKAFADI